MSNADSAGNSQPGTEPNEQQTSKSSTTFSNKSSVVQAEPAQQAKRIAKVQQPEQAQHAHGDKYVQQLDGIQQSQLSPEAGSPVKKGESCQDATPKKHKQSQLLAILPFSMRKMRSKNAEHAGTIRTPATLKEAEEAGPEVSSAAGEQAQGSSHCRR